MFFDNLEVSFSKLPKLTVTKPKHSSIHKKHILTLDEAYMYTTMWFVVVWIYHNKSTILYSLSIEKGKRITQSRHSSGWKNENLVIWEIRKKNQKLGRE